MKNLYLIPVAMTLVAGCSQNEAPTANVEATNAIAANTRADGSVIDESKPHEHSEANAHAEPMGDMAMMTPQAGDSVATKGYKLANSRMMQAMPPYTGDADVDFNKQMRTHHLSAIDMAKVQLANGKDAETRALATQIIAEQEKEIAQIDAWLAKRGQ